MGLLQSLREVPGFLAFAVIFILLAIREQPLALLAIALAGIGTALTGFFPTAIGLYCTTVVMSLGFHYYETLQTSLSLQWIEVERAPMILGRVIATASSASLAAYGLIYLTRMVLKLDYAWVYLCSGTLSLAILIFAAFAFPRFPSRVRQRNQMVLRRRYWLYYALTFLAGARRQIFVVFAAFMMVQRFGYSVESITSLYVLNCLFNMTFASRIGRLVGRLGERRALAFEYIGLIGVFVSYAYVEDARVAAVLYVIDHAFFALSIAIKTYFQKIADPADIASTAGVGFTINHIAAVAIPAAFGLLWDVNPRAVFLCGALMATGSLLMTRLIPRHPEPGAEVTGIGHTLRAPS